MPTMRLLTAACLVVLLFSGCTTAPTAGPGAGPAAPVTEPVGTATIRGSEETSALFDNFTAFIAAVDGQPVAAGRAGWDTPIALKAGRRVLTVAFKRGAFSATAQLELQAVAHGDYQLKYTTDAQLFGKNSFCDFWIADFTTGRPVTAVSKAAVVKGG